MRPSNKVFMISMSRLMRVTRLFFFRKTKPAALLIPLVLFLGLFLSHISLGVAPLNIYSNDYYKNIDQPIAFNHKVHVTDNQISCESCHSQARISDSAGVPSVNSCIGCHVSVKGTTEEQQKQIAKISNYWNANQSIPWNKIHDLPDFVRFSHKVHLNAGFDCTSCHGDVSKEIMPIPQYYKGEIPLSMGWCVTCHRTDWPVDAAGKISLPVRSTRGGNIIADPHPAVANKNGPMDCLVCHK